MASQDLGPLGPRDGPAVKVPSPAVDALRSVVGWFAVAFLLSVRKSNRKAQAWALFVPLAAVWVALAMAERLLNAYMIFHYHQYICSSLADLLRFFSISLALLLAFADRLDIPWNFPRFLIVTLILFFSTCVQIALNQWPFLDPGQWTFYFAIILSVFVLGNALLKAVLNRVVAPAAFGRWYSISCLALGLIPSAVLGGLELYLSRSMQLQSTEEQFRVAVVLGTGLSLPFVVYSAFLLLALRCPVYRERFARAFGAAHLHHISAGPLTPTTTGTQLTLP